MDKVWLTKKLFFQKINAMPVLLKVKGIGAFQHKSEEFALVAIYISGLNDDCSEVYACIKCKLRLIERLKVNMFISNDVFYTKGFLINLVDASVYISSCGVNITISTKHYSEFLKQKVPVHSTIFILPKSKALIIF